MSDTADIVVAGAGHNSLITAAYLAKAGHDCVILDARPIPGGGAASEELLLPGYKIDTCSTGHTLIRVNPLLAKDELGLQSRYGLRYVEPDPVAHVVFPDGEYMTMWMDAGRTAEEIARFSQRDADAYRALLKDYDQVRDAYAAVRELPPGWGPSLEERLAALPVGNRWLRINAMSSWDVIRAEFEDRHVRSFMLWMALQTVQPVDSAGSGPLAYSLIYGRQRRSWSIPVGGSGTLTDALVTLLKEHGARFVCDQKVKRLILEDGRCVGVETESGEQFRARRAVLSTIHVKHLVDMAPPEAWGDDFRFGVRTYDIGLSNFGAYYLTTEPPRYDTPDGTRSAVSSGVVGWPEDVIRMGHDVRDGRFIDYIGWVLVATPTLVDDTRAPHGHHTVKFLGPQAAQLPPGETDWAQATELATGAWRRYVQRFASNFTDDKILASLLKSPHDFEHTNPHMILGTFHGGDRGVAQSGALRPVPGYAQYRMPIPGLYQTGGTTHPGGSITGSPGRNAARVMLHDFGQDLDAVVAGEAAGVA